MNIQLSVGPSTHPLFTKQLQVRGTKCEMPEDALLL